MLVENIQRLDLTPLQEARTYAALLEPPHQLSQRTIAKRVGRNVSHISRRLTLLRLPTTAQAAVDAGQLPIADALSMAGGVDGHTDLALIAAAWILYQGGASSTDALHQALSHRKRADQVTRNLADSRRRADDEGVQLIDPDDFGRDAEHKRIRDPEDIAAAREAGTLVAAPSDDGGLIYYDTAPEKPGPEAPSGPRGPGWRPKRSKDEPEGRPPPPARRPQPSQRPNHPRPPSSPTTSRRTRSAPPTSTPSGSPRDS